MLKKDKVAKEKYLITLNKVYFNWRVAYKLLMSIRNLHWNQTSIMKAMMWAIKSNLLGTKKRHFKANFKW